MLASLRQRASEVGEARRRRQEGIEEAWVKGKPRIGGVLCEDWVRRVELLGDDLFVGTASRGVLRFRLGDEAPRQTLKVEGNPGVFVMADHQGQQDPETSVTSLCYDGRWLAAGLAGGRVHVWGADGELVLDRRLPRPAPCYVALVDGSVVAASGEALQRFPVGGGGAAGGPDASVELPCRAHCLAEAGEELAVGLADGTLACFGRADLARARQHQVHRGAVSAACGVDGGFVSGDETGELARWRVEDDSWQCAWQGAKHEGRVVAIREGAGGILVSGALDGTLRAWKAGSGSPHFAVPGHKVWFGSICVGEEKGIMVTDGRDNAVLIYDFREAAQE